MEGSASSLRDHMWEPGRRGGPLRRFRRAVIETVVDGAEAPADPTARDMSGFVEEELKAMPLHLRVGVEAVSALLLTRTTIEGRGDFARRGAEARATAIGSWEASRLGPVRQYVRFLRSLVLFALHERATASEP